MYLFNSGQHLLFLGCPSVGPLSWTARIRTARTTAASARPSKAELLAKLSYFRHGKHDMKRGSTNDYLVDDRSQPKSAVLLLFGAR